jgi:diaminopimelate epimerase
MHGAHNAFAVLDERTPAHAQSEYGTIAQRAARQFGVDGLLVIGNPGEAQMRIFNADGSEPEMCGNGIRCVVRYLTDRTGVEPASILTKKGRVPTSVLAREPEYIVRADLGPLRFPDDAAAQAAPNGAFDYVSVEVGNPHAVVFREPGQDLDPEPIARELSGTPAFPEGVNAHVAVLLDDGSLRARHFERGVGETQACGSGAVAIAAAAMQRFGLSSPVTVHVPGGTLRVSYAPGSHAQLEGPAEFIADRTLDP